MYEVQSEAVRHRVTLTFSKDYSHDAEALGRDLRAAVEAAKVGSGFFDILVSMNDIPVMTQERAENSEALMKWCNANGLRWAAFASPSSLQQLQFKRLAERNENYSYFSTHADAEQWLNAQMVQS